MMAPPSARLSARTQSARISHAQRQRSLSSVSESIPSGSDSSDKENLRRNPTQAQSLKRKSTSTAMSSPPPTDGPSKRRRVTNNTQSSASQRQESQYYDPDQDENVKRNTTRRLRELNANLNDSRAEFLQRGNAGLRDTAREADDVFQDVKQTHIAAIDSRLLVNVGDLAYKKISSLTLGENSTGIDVDDFLSKCASFMRGHASTTSSNTQTISRNDRRPPQQTQPVDTDDEEVDDGHGELDWAHLGRTLCFPANRRPCLSSFLLGPLSVQKKVRQPTQRKAIQRTQTTGPTTRPILMTEEEAEKQEAASLTSICAEIANLLAKAEEDGQAAVIEEQEELEADGKELDDNVIKAIMRKHGVADNGGVPLFAFCVNPKSFGQTVENFFYTSFLIKEGRVGLDFDSDGLPTLGMVGERNVEERQESVRNQAVFTLDFETWEEIVYNFGLTGCIIPHRRQEEYELDDGVIQLPDKNTNSRALDISSPASSSQSRPFGNNDLYGPG